LRFKSYSFFGVIKMQVALFRKLLVVVVSAYASLCGSMAQSDPYQWTISQIQGLEDVTAGFHGGAGQLSTIDSITPILNGVQLEVTYRIGQDADPLAPNYGLMFARVSLQDCCFDVPGLDLGDFSSSSLKISTSTSVTVQSFLYTDFMENGTTIDDGDAVPGESFSLLFWEHNSSLAAGGATDVDFDFSSATEFDGGWSMSNPQMLQGADAVRGWGMQIAKFSGMTIGEPVQATITVEGVVPEPSSIALWGLCLSCLLLNARANRRRG
jgi:hypothetical protein